MSKQFVVLDCKVDIDEKNEQRLIRNENGTYSLQYRPMKGIRKEWTTFFTSRREDNARKHFLLDFSRKAPSFYY